MLTMLLVFLVLASSDLRGAEARKTYIVKERIHKGDLQVHKPRVRTSDVQFCFFKDSHNDWCLDMDENWVVSVNNKYTYVASTLADGTTPAYRGYQMYNSTQMASWSSVFNLALLYYSSQNLGGALVSTGVLKD